MRNPDVLTLYQAACKRYPGGITAIAALMGISPVILANKLNSNNEQNHLSLDEALEIIEITQEMRLAVAHAQRVGGTVTRLPDAHTSDDGVLPHFMETVILSGNVAKEMRTAASKASELGRRFSSRERAAIKEQLDDLISVAVTFRQSL